MAETTADHPYPSAVRMGPLIAVSGRLGVTERGGSTIVPGGFEAEARSALGHVADALQSVGASVEGILQVVVYLTDIADRDALNRVYTEFLGDHRPARSCVGVASLPYGGCVEIEALAICDPA